MRNKLTAALVAIGAATLLLASVGAQAGSQTIDLLSPGPQGSPGPVYSASGVTLERSAAGLAVSIRFPTPVSGSYTYPQETVAGRPEAFTGWLIVFNHPELCNGECDGDDLGTSAPARGGAYLIGGEVGRTSTLNFGTQVSTDQLSLLPGGSEITLTHPLTATVHVVVAPHGEFDPADPSQLTSPAGSPNCQCWWTAFFLTDGAGPNGLPSTGSGGLAEIGASAGLTPIAWALIAAGSVAAIALPARRLVSARRGRDGQDHRTPNA
jgi:hypothetical protein